MINAGSNGAVTWVDLSTPDVSAAVSFYREVLGWSDVEESDTPMGRYYIGKVGERQVGGLMAQGPEMAGTPPMWTTFIYVDDIDASVSLVEELGGTVLEKPFDIPGDAKVAVAADPTGAVFALFGGPVIEGEYFSRDIGGVSWVELLTRDPAAAAVFYAGLFGWRAETDDSGGTPYTVFKIGEEMVAGMTLMPQMVPAEAPAHWSVYFTVSDCAAAGTEATRLGGQLLVPTTSIDMGKLSVLEDPQGATFNIMEYTA